MGRATNDTPFSGGWSSPRVRRWKSPRRIPACFRDFSVKKTAIPSVLSRDGDADLPKARSGRVGHGAPVFNAINAIVGDNAGGRLYSRSLRPQDRPHADVQPPTLLRSVPGATLRDSPQDLPSILRPDRSTTCC